MGIRLAMDTDVAVNLGPRSQAFRASTLLPYRVAYRAVGAADEPAVPSVADFPMQLEAVVVCRELIYSVHLQFAVGFQCCPLRTQGSEDYQLIRFCCRAARRTENVERR